MINSIISENTFLGFQGANTIKNGSTSTVINDTNGITFANLPSTAANGSHIFISDADPTTSPCTHAGAQTGSTAFRQNGAWKCY